MKSTPRWIRNRDVVGVHGRIRVEVGLGGDDGPDLGVGERLEDGLHVAHRTPDVHGVSAAVGVAHHQLAAGSRCRTPGCSNTPSPCRWWPDRDLESARAIEARMMFQLASSDGSTGPRAFSTNAGSASVLSPNSDNVPGAPGAPPVELAGPVVPVAVRSSSSSSLPHAAATNASTATMPMILILLMFLLLGRWRSPSRIDRLETRRILADLPPFSSASVAGCASWFAWPTRFGPLRSRSTCSTPLMIRSPETSMPPMMTRPNTTNWRAVGSPIARIIWLRPVRKKAAANVDIGLARPPVSEAPPITTAAIGPRRYGVPTATPGLRRSPASATPGDGVEDRGRPRRRRSGSGSPGHRRRGRPPGWPPPPGTCGRPPCTGGRRSGRW